MGDCMLHVSMFFPVFPTVTLYTTLYIAKCATKWFREMFGTKSVSDPHLHQTLRKPKNHRCLGCTTQNLPSARQLSRHISVDRLFRNPLDYIRQYSCTGGGMPPGHTYSLRPRNLWHISRSFINMIWSLNKYYPILQLVDTVFVTFMYQNRENTCEIWLD